ncbi:MAG TPA: protein-disulfide reductase DsbD domain-containing protein, partial [Verrucomicrobiae bacterium]|nr:protein-disulfide reductase DsbD domain-containing protein [Verrucomicrobiae bacterium]
MRTVFRILLALFLAGNVAHAAHTRARLILSANTVKPGDTLWVGVDLKMDPGWHTYWKNSGDAGLPTKIDWQLPPGLSAGTVQWPLPDKFPPAEVTTYGYEGEVVLLVPLTVETNSNLPAGQVPLKAKLTWLECSADICIPGATNVATTLQIGSTTQPSADAGTINEWLAKAPQTNTLFSFQSWWEAPAKDDTRPL